MNANERRFMHIVAREALFLAIAALGSLVFIQHALLYLDRTWRPQLVPTQAYLLSTLVLYVFLRAITVVALMRPPRVRAGIELCPECGQPFDDGTPKGVAAHRQAPLTPRPTEREILAAVALRKAIDDARAARARAVSGIGVRSLRLPGDIENAPIRPREDVIVPRRIVVKRDLKGPRGPEGPA